MPRALDEAQQGQPPWRAARHAPTPSGWARWGWALLGLAAVLLCALSPSASAFAQGRRERGTSGQVRRATRGASSRRAASRAGRRRAGRAHDERLHEGPPPPGGSVSIGRHNRGHLLFGHRLEASDHVRLRQPDAAEHHGTDELVRLLERTAAEVAAAHPGARLSIGDLSAPHGGRLRPHRSHRSGRDADVGFFVSDAGGAPRETTSFVRFRADGTGRDDRGLRFDDARNWAIVAALLGQGEVPVQHVFVARGLRERLLAWGAANGASPELLERAARVLDQPRRGGRHDDHFHVRVYCDPGDRPRCVDDPPFHPWVTPPTAAERVAAQAPHRPHRGASRSRGSRASAGRTHRAERAGRAPARGAASPGG